MDDEDFIRTLKQEFMLCGRDVVALSAHLCRVSLQHPPQLLFRKTTMTYVYFFTQNFLELSDQPRDEVSIGRPW